MQTPGTSSGNRNHGTIKPKGSIIHSVPSTSNHYNVFLLFRLQSLWNLGTKNSSGLTPPALRLTRNCPWTNLYSRGTDMHHRKTYHMIAIQPGIWRDDCIYRKHMSRDRYLLLCDVTADTENTSSSIVVCWAVFTELLLGSTLIKSVTILSVPSGW
jgi:hypothetical protein